MSVQALALRHGATEQRIFFAVASAPVPEIFLSQEETARLAEFRFAAKKEGFLLGRIAAKRALGALLAEPDLRAIDIASGANGQPIVRHPRSAGTEVTLSHSHGLAVALAYPANHPMGIDLESVSADAADTIIASLEMSKAESEWLSAAGIDRETACGILWTAREAVAKALKTGVNGPLGALALASIRAAGEGGWTGDYLNFPQSICLCRAIGGRVLSIALPKEAQLSPWPALP